MKVQADFKNFTKHFGHPGQAGLSLILGILIGLLGFIEGATSHAVTEYSSDYLPFVTDLTTMRPSLRVDISDQTISVQPPITKLKKRATLSPNNPTVESLNLLISNPERQIPELAKQLAKSGKQRALMHAMSKAWHQSKLASKDSEIRTLVLDQHTMKYMNLHALARIYSKKHHKVEVPAKQFQENPAIETELFRQLQLFLTKRELKLVRDKISRNENLPLDEVLLPTFAKKMIKNYLLYKGPNCFHAALAFQSPNLTSSQLINVKEEDGYHRAMINYDELWRVISRSFYEVDPRVSPLEYGDMLVFFDVPKNVKDRVDFVNYRWIRHAATYLFNGYAFSKGSKSANSPYIVRTLDEEWRTWKNLTANLGIKVFRRSQKNVTKRPPNDLTDWLY